MSQPYRIFGMELSPYSVKVRSYFRYKQIPHEWIVREQSRMEEFQRRAKLPLIPLVVTPEDENIQDSTPIIEAMEKRFPEPSIHPHAPVLAFLSALIEEYGDEWGNKPMFHYRWWYEEDQRSASLRLAKAMLPDADQVTIETTADAIKERMVPRLSFVGSSRKTKALIEESYGRQLAILEKHLARRDFLFGGRPAFADFGLSAQLYECLTDPTPGRIMRAGAPRVVQWIERIIEPEPAGGAFETWRTLGPTLEPLLKLEIGGLFLPWSTANARALAAGRSEFTVELADGSFTQQTQKYHARSLGVLMHRYEQVEDKSTLDSILARTGCLEWLQGG
jgi:glutathione S-transferase